MPKLNGCSDTLPPHAQWCFYLSEVACPLSGADIEMFDCGAAGEGLDFCDNLCTVVEEFLADDCMGGEHEQTSARIDFDWVRVAGVGRADELGPVRVKPLFGGFASDFVFRQKRLHELGERLSCAFALSLGLAQRHAAKVGDDRLGQLTELMRLGDWLSHFCIGSFCVSAS